MNENVFEKFSAIEKKDMHKYFEVFGIAGDFEKEFQLISLNFTSVVGFSSLHHRSCLDSYYKDLLSGCDLLIPFSSSCKVCFETILGEDMVCYGCASDKQICLKCGEAL